MRKRFDGVDKLITCYAELHRKMCRHYEPNQIFDIMLPGGNGEVHMEWTEVTEKSTWSGQNESNQQEIHLEVKRKI